MQTFYTSSIEAVQDIFNSVNVPVKFEQIPLLEFKDIDQARRNEQEVMLGYNISSNFNFS